MRKFFFERFGLIALASLGLSFAAGALTRRSLAGGLWFALGTAGAVVAFLVVLGAAGSALERWDELKEEDGGFAALARAWAKGLVSWNPPHHARGLFLSVWAGILAVAGLIVPRLSPPGRTAAVALLVVVAGCVNAVLARDRSGA